MRARRDIAHGHLLAALDTRLLPLPWLADVEQSEFLAALEHGFYLSGTDLEIHDQLLAATRLSLPRCNELNVQIRRCAPRSCALP